MISNDRLKKKNYFMAIFFFTPKTFARNQQRDSRRRSRCSRIKLMHTAWVVWKTRTTLYNGSIRPPGTVLVTVDKYTSSNLTYHPPSCWRNTFFIFLFIGDVWPGFWTVACLTSSKPRHCLPDYSNLVWQYTAVIYVDNQ